MTKKGAQHEAKEIPEYWLLALEWETVTVLTLVSEAEYRIFAFITNNLSQ
jgi:hypothetical protein